MLLSHPASPSHLAEETGATESALLRLPQEAEPGECTRDGKPRGARSPCSAELAWTHMAGTSGGGVRT